jgi:hypothetical protein
MSEDPAASSEESGPQPLEFIRPWIYDKQRLAIFEPRDSRGDLARYSLIEASTKVGKTIGCLAWLAERAFAGTEGQNFWWVAPVYRQAKIAYRRAKRGLDRRLYTANETEMAMRLCNGATIAFLSADRPDGLYGEDVFAAVIDEASRVKEDAWHAVRSTLTATRGPARIIGNVKGRRNWFYQLARRAEAGEPGMSHHRIVAADAVKAGVLAAEELEDARRLLPEPVFRELFLAEPSDDGGNPFGLDSIAACVAPLSLEAPLFWGWDLAKSRDFSVGIALDAEARVCRLERFQSPWTETKRRILAATGRARALVDSTGVGDPVLEDLQAARPGVFEGFRFSASSKQQLMEGLALAIQARAVSFPEGPIRAELETFDYEYTRTGVRYAAPEGLHDDCVCALALAIRLRSMPSGIGIIEYYRRLVEEKAARGETPGPARGK